MLHELARIFIHQGEEPLMFFHGSNQNFLGYLQIGGLERPNNGIGTFRRIDRLIQQVCVHIRREAGLLTQDRDLFFNHAAAALWIGNDPMTFKPLQIGFGVSNRNPLRTP